MASRLRVPHKLLHLVEKRTLTDRRQSGAKKPAATGPDAGRVSPGASGQSGRAMPERRKVNRRKSRATPAGKKKSGG